jgi:hypothetical protein
MSTNKHAKTARDTVEYWRERAEIATAEESITAGLLKDAQARVAELEVEAARLREALGKAAKTAADEVLGNYGGETMAKAVFHAVKTVARAALAREGGE